MELQQCQGGHLKFLCFFFLQMLNYANINIFLNLQSSFGSVSKIFCLVLHFIVQDCIKGLQRSLPITSPSLFNKQIYTANIGLVSSAPSKLYPNKMFKFKLYLGTWLQINKHFNFEAALNAQFYDYAWNTFFFKLFKVYLSLIFFLSPLFVTITSAGRKLGAELM